MGDSSDGDSGCLFNSIMVDMKTMVPIWEDFLVKGSKFYSAIKSTASTADAFLDSFQKLADATTSSKDDDVRSVPDSFKEVEIFLRESGATRDIGVLFTKLVMRHRSIENKLKAYVGIITDSLFGPLQEKLEEWKKSASQLEKDHSKDFKKAKGDAKKSASEVLKLKKKVVKKGRHEYYDQYKDALKLSNINVATLEEQERQYLRRLMIEERSRVVFFFDCYRPVVEQELSLVGEIENLQTVVEETIKKCKNPSTLPLIAEDAINNYKAPDQCTLPKSEASSPPPSPTLESARQRAFTSIPKGSGSLQRSHTVSAGSGYSTLRKKGSGGPAPKPVGIPTLKSPTRSLSNTDVPYDNESRASFHSSSGNVSNFSSMSSLSTASADQLAADPGTPDHGTAAYEDSLREQVAYYTQHDAKTLVSATNGVQHLGNPAQATRTSWSSLETSDSSGIGSYCSLTSQGRAQQAQEKQSGYNSDGQYEMTEGYPEYDVNDEMYIQMTQLQTTPASVQQNLIQQQQHFQRNTDTTSSLRGTRASGAPTYRRSNSLTDGDNIPAMAEYRMNMPRRPSNTVYAKHTPPVAKPTAYQVFANPQTPAQLRSKMSPTGSPVKTQRPPAPARKVSSPPNLFGSSRPSHNSQSGPNLASGSGGIYQTSNASSIYASSAGSGMPGEIIYQRSTGSSDPNLVYTSTDRKDSPENEYAVPNIQQAPPKSPDVFPPPPGQLQQQLAHQPLKQQPPQAKYDTTQQIQNYLQQQELSQRLAANQGYPPEQQLPVQQRDQYQVRNFHHQQQQQQLPQQQQNQQQQHYPPHQQPQSHYQQHQPQYAQQQPQQQQQPQYAQQQQPPQYAQQHQQQFAQQQQQSQQYPSSQYQRPQYDQSIAQETTPQQYRHPQQQQLQQQQQHYPQQPRPLSASHSAEDDMPSACPGSFLDEIQQKRTLVRRRTSSEHHHPGNS